MENNLVEFAEDVAYQFGYYCQNKRAALHYARRSVHIGMGIWYSWLGKSASRP